ncbi:cation-transporting P-type ATPase [Granulosicoccaceae sp. 1_MG-2023]|nr:cation-transporting P-type ATPase [Granulosicoccaceae sp. 1_MG-2023]
MHKQRPSPQHDSATPPPVWHTQTPEDLLAALDSSTDGLNSAAATQRLAEHGPNRLPQAKSHSPLMRFLEQFHNVLIYVLIGAGLITLLLGHAIDSAVIFGVVLVNAIIGFLQEGKAENALRAIGRMLSPTALVMRDGKQVSVDAESLVPGDIVLLQPGDRVPADLRLLKVNGLQIQESALTGESLAVAKQAAALAAGTVLGDRSCMAYSGTLVTRGQGRGVVVATGAATELGHISRLVSGVDKVTTPLLRQMAHFGNRLTAAILAIAALTFALGVWLRGYGADEMFLASVSLAVAAIPEGLPAIMTITLALGVQRMARRNAIIRKLPAVETLGAVSVICSDKTGTLTRNELTVRSIATAQADYELSGTGYDVSGSLSRVDGRLSGEPDSTVTTLLRAGVLCNDTALERDGESWKVHGDPLEGALCIAAIKAGLDTNAERQRHPRLDVIPFDSSHKFMASLHRDKDAALLVVKGAPERILDMCEQQATADGPQPLQREVWLEKIDAMAAKGQRILAIASHTRRAECSALQFEEVQSGLVLQGLVGLLDPPREEAIAAIERCHQAGIRVKMITGDHAATALSIAGQLNLQNHRRALSGQQLDELDDSALSAEVTDVDVYARVTPEHKLRLVKLLQAHGLIVAMTGDGVNDAPALKRADVGTAMGRNGTEAAKEAAEMVLADDNFASIGHAVEEGRTVYDNLRKAILFILPTNGGEALIILAAILFGFSELPLTPVQILWVNMITAVTLALALAFEPAETDVMQRPPRTPDAPLLNRHLIWRIGFVSVVLMLGTFGLYLYALDRGIALDQARTIAVNTLVLFEIFYLFNSRYITAPVLNLRGLTGNRPVLLAIAVLLLFQLAFTYLPALQLLFGSSAISLTDWISSTLVASSVLFLVEAEKYLLRRRHNTQTG